MLINQNLIPFFSQPAYPVCRQAGGRQGIHNHIVSLFNRFFSIEYPNHTQPPNTSSPEVDRQKQIYLKSFHFSPPGIAKEGRLWYAFRWLVLRI